MKLITLHEIGRDVTNLSADKEIFVNAERIVFIETNGSIEFPITRVYMAPGYVEVRESANEVRSLIIRNR